MRKGLERLTRAGLMPMLVMLGCGSGEKASIVEDKGEQKEPTADTAWNEEGVECLPGCEGRECGADGCGESCGQCAAGLACTDDGKCKPFSCKSTKDCPDMLVCAEDWGQCVECTGEEDCPEGLKCGADHACHDTYPCVSDKDCKKHDMICDKDAAVCVECRETAHCTGDEHCKQGFCIPDVCVQGEAYCDEDTVVACSGDGSQLSVVVVCAPAGYCQSGECEPYVCVPDSLWCVGDVLKTCDSAGKEVEKQQDCAADGLHCFEGACTKTKCTPSKKFCTDSVTVGICDDSGAQYETAPCPGQHYCDQGTCQPWLCTPNESSCAGDFAQTCNPSGSGFSAEIDCSLLGKSCSDGQCTTCLGSCEGKQCGDDGCGGSCGSCAPDYTCTAGKCIPPGLDCNQDGVDDGCPDLPGYNVTCNLRQHCEYAYVDTTGWKKWDVWIWIPPGTFLMGSPKEESGHQSNEEPMHQVTFAKGFFIAKYEIVVEQYEACMANGKCEPLDSAGWDANGWGTNTSLKGRADHPQNRLSWQSAIDFCVWLAPSGNLPSESEWEYAAKGPAHRKYPWGDAPEPSCSGGVAVYDQDYWGRNMPWGCDPCSTAGCSGTRAVGSCPGGASWSGGLDMAGNVLEWCLDKGHASYQWAPADGSAWVDMEGSAKRVRRGGGFCLDAPYLRSASRWDSPPEDPGAEFGGRCVRH